MTIAGLTFTVDKAGAAGTCTYSVTPTSVAFRKGGGPGSVSVTAGAGCGWIAVSQAT